jgi:high affinity Mn2+ porin
MGRRRLDDARRIFRSVYDSQCDCADPGSSQFQLDGELERRFMLWDREGKLAFTVFQSHGRMGTFGDALLFAKQTDETPNTADVRHFATRSGISFNAEQSLTDDIGLFARGGIDEAGVEPYEYTDIDRTVGGGISVSGKIWSRNDDIVGLAGVTNWIGRQHIAYLAAGGLGVIIGDGALPRPAPERIVEAYYNLAVVKEVHLTFDTQFIDNPAYNAERGPVIVVGARLHAEI